MVLPQRAERIRDVQVAIRVAQDAASGSENDLRRRREGFCAFECDLWRDEGSGRSQWPSSSRTKRMVAGRYDFLDPDPRNEARQSRHRRDLAHPFTTCGALKEMERQGVKPKLLIGLTS